jgi:hypothetical protein
MLLLLFFSCSNKAERQQKIGDREKIKAARGMMKTAQQALEEIVQ